MFHTMKIDPSLQQQDAWTKRNEFPQRNAKDRSLLETLDKDGAMDHENILFYGASYGNAVVHIKPHHYLGCKDFAWIYKTLRNDQGETVAMHDSIELLFKEQPRKHYNNKEGVYKPGPDVLRQFAIHRDLLYRTMADGTSVVNKGRYSTSNQSWSPVTGRCNQERSSKLIFWFATLLTL